MGYKTAAIYTRVSTNMQDERGSKETQKILIQEFALKNNYYSLAFPLFLLDLLFYQSSEEILFSAP